MKRTIMEGLLGTLPVLVRVETLMSNEKELNWLRRRPFAHVLSSIEQLWWDAQVTGREAVRTLNVSEMAREIGKYI